jgi:hypothetical protein
MLRKPHPPSLRVDTSRRQPNPVALSASRAGPMILRVCSVMQSVSTNHVTIELHILIKIADY